MIMDHIITVQHLTAISSFEIYLLKVIEGNFPEVLFGIDSHRFIV
jgi:hypothetical protein